jgi:hypothetical protein
MTFFVSVIGFAAVVWFGVTVELGQRTLFGHLRAIGGTAEAHQLWDGTKEKVTDFVGIEAARRAEAAKAAFKNPGVVQVPAPSDAEGQGKPAPQARALATPPASKPDPQARALAAPQAQPAPVARPAHALPSPAARPPALERAPARPKVAAHAAKPATVKPGAAKPDPHKGLRAQATAAKPR